MKITKRFGVAAEDVDENNLNVVKFGRDGKRKNKERTEHKTSSWALIGAHKIQTGLETGQRHFLSKA